MIQEALTNAAQALRRHDGEVRVDYKPTCSRSRCSTTAAAAPRARRTSIGGHGLIGMRERVSLHGGHLRAGPTPHGGFAVHATFPLNGNAA